MTMPDNLPKCVRYCVLDVEGDGFHVTDDSFSGRPFVGIWDHATDASTAWVLPTDSAEVESLVRAILQATGCDIAAESDGFWGVVKVIGPPT